MNYVVEIAICHRNGGLWRSYPKIRIVLFYNYVEEGRIQIVQGGITPIADSVMCMPMAVNFAT